MVPNNTLLFPDCWYWFFFFLYRLYNEPCATYETASDPPLLYRKLRIQWNMIVSCLYVHVDIYVTMQFHTWHMVHCIICIKSTVPLESHIRQVWLYFYGKMNSYNFASWVYHDIEIYAQPCYNKYLLYKYNLFIDIKFLRNHDWLIKWLSHSSGGRCRVLEESKWEWVSTLRLYTNQAHPVFVVMLVLALQNFARVVKQTTLPVSS
jgi:hypothetical protein